jgi:hypothetical protein
MEEKTYKKGRKMPKSYEVSFDNKTRIVKVQIAGLATHTELCIIREEAFKLCQEKGCSKLLIDLLHLNTRQSSIYDCFYFGESVAHIPLGVWIAHVMPIDDKTREDVKFTSIVETNRGVLAKNFETVEDAKKWLHDSAWKEPKATV